MDFISSIITAIANNIMDFFDSLLAFLYGLKYLAQLVKEFLGVLFGSNTHFFQWIFAKLIELAVLAYFTLMNWLVPFVWGIASIIAKDLYAAAGIQTYAAAIPSDIYSVMSYMRVFEAIDMIITAYITRFIMRFIPFVGG